MTQVKGSGSAENKMGVKGRPPEICKTDLRRYNEELLSFIERGHFIKEKQKV